MPVRIEGIETVWEDGGELRDFMRLDRATLRRGELARELTSWEELEDALRGSEIKPGETLAVDFSFYFEERGESGRMMPEGVCGRMRHLISCSQSVPGMEARREAVALEPLASGEAPQGYALPGEYEGIEASVGHDPASPPAPGEQPLWPGLPYTGGRMRLFLCSGLALMVLGLLLVFYPFSTDLYSRKAQERLRGELAAGPGAVQRRDRAEGGGAWALLEIPSIGLAAAVVAGASGGDLMKGPGWIQGSAEPGRGNTVIAGHRTMYGGWFFRLEELKQGDEVLLTYRGETYSYRVERIWRAKRDDRGAVAPCGYPALTLITCDPDGDRSRRLVVRARLAGR